MKKKEDQDENQIASLIVSKATGQDQIGVTAKNPAAVALGRLGGLKGGKARALKLSPKKRSLIARKAAQKRWTPRLVIKKI